MLDRLIANPLLTHGSRLILAVSATVLLSACSPKEPRQVLLESLGKNVLVPDYQQFANSTHTLQQNAQQFCASVTPESFETLRNDWREAMADWHKVKAINFGPITVDNQSWKFQFWPDNHNLIDRKINALIESSESIDLERISKASVVVQGLSAVEHLLFNEGDQQLALYTSDDNKQRRCDTLVAVTEHTALIANNLNDAWRPDKGDYLTTLMTHNPENGEYKSVADALGAVVGSLIEATEIAKRDQLSRPLGYKTKGDRARPYQSEAWRSRYSTVLIAATLSGAKSLYSGANQYGIDDYLREHDNADLANQIETLFSDIEQQLTTIPPLFDALNNPQEREKVAKLYTTVNELVQLMGTKLPSALDVNLGFNANDGD